MEECAPWNKLRPRNKRIKTAARRRVRATSLTVEIISEVVLRGFLIRIKYKARGMKALLSMRHTRRRIQCALAETREATARNKLNYLRDVSLSVLSNYSKASSGFGLLAAPKIVHTAHTHSQTTTMSSNHTIEKLVAACPAADHDLKLRRRWEKKRLSSVFFSFSPLYTIVLLSCVEFSLAAIFLNLKQEHANGLILALNKSRLQKGGEDKSSQCLEWNKFYIPIKSIEKLSQFQHVCFVSVLSAILLE